MSKFKFFANPISAVAPKLDPVSVIGKQVGGQAQTLLAEDDKQRRILRGQGSRA